MPKLTLACQVHLGENGTDTEICVAGMKLRAAKETLIKSFDRLRTNGKCLIPFVVSLSNHERNRINQRFPKGAFEAARDSNHSHEES